MVVMMGCFGLLVLVGGRFSFAVVGRKRRLANLAAVAIEKMDRPPKKRPPTRFFCVSVAVMPVLSPSVNASSMSDSTIVATCHSTKRCVPSARRHTRPTRTRDLPCWCSARCAASLNDDDILFVLLGEQDGMLLLLLLLLVLLGRMEPVSIGGGFAIQAGRKRAKTSSPLKKEREKEGKMRAAFAVAARALV